MEHKIRVVSFEMSTHKRDIVAKGILSYLGERINVEMDITQMCAGTLGGGTLYYDSGEYNGFVMADHMGNMSADLRKNDEVIFRECDNHWRFSGDDLDDIPLKCEIRNPAIWHIVNRYGEFFYTVLAYTGNYSKRCPQVRWRIYNICDDGMITVNWTVKNLNRTTNNDGYDCDATAYYTSFGERIENKDSEPVYHLVTYDKDSIRNMEVFYNGERVLNIEGTVFDRLCDAFLDYIDLCNVEYGE